jgi:uncharacterized membrane protein YkgB
VDLSIAMFNVSLTFSTQFGSTAAIIDVLIITGFREDKLTVFTGKRPPTAFVSLSQIQMKPLLFVRDLNCSDSYIKIHK